MPIARDVLGVLLQSPPANVPKNVNQVGVVRVQQKTRFTTIDIILAFCRQQSIHPDPLYLQTTDLH